MISTFYILAISEKILELHSYNHVNPTMGGLGGRERSGVKLMSIPYPPDKPRSGKPSLAELTFHPELYSSNLPTYHTIVIQRTYTD